MVLLVVVRRLIRINYISNPNNQKGVGRDLKRSPLRGVINAKSHLINDCLQPSSKWFTLDARSCHLSRGCRLRNEYTSYRTIRLKPYSNK